MSVARVLAAAAAAAVAVVSLGACGNPSARTVAEDVIDALPDLTEEERTCLQGKLDAYTEEDLNAVAEGDPTPSSPTPAFQAFVDDLAECTAGG